MNDLSQTSDSDRTRKAAATCGWPLLYRYTHRQPSETQTLVSVNGNCDQEGKGVTVEPGRDRSSRVWRSMVGTGRTHNRDMNMSGMCPLCCIDRIHRYAAPTPNAEGHDGGWMLDRGGGQVGYPAFPRPAELQLSCCSSSQESFCHPSASLTTAGLLERNSMNSMNSMMMMMAMAPCSALDWCTVALHEE